MSRKKCPHCEIPVTPTAANVCPFCSRDIRDVPEIDAATLAEMARQSDEAKKTAADKARGAAKQDRRRIGRKIGFALGMVVGYFVWQMKVRGPGGFFLAIFIAIIIEEIFTAVFCAISGRGAIEREDSQVAALLERSKTTSDIAECTRCDYSGLMIVKRRRSMTVTVLISVLTIVIGSISAKLVITVGPKGLLLLCYAAPFVIYGVMTTGTKLICPKCNRTVRTAK